MNGWWPNIFYFAFEVQHNSKFKRLVALALRAVIKAMLFNLDFRISFFSGIGAMSKIGNIGDFLEGQNTIHKELKSIHRPFFDKITKKSKVGSLYKVLKPYFPPAEVSIFSAGENTSQMDKACDVAVTYLQKSTVLKKKIKSFGMTVLGYLVVFTVFIVIFARIISDAIKPIERQLQGAIPDSTRFFIDMNTFITNNLIYIVILMTTIILLTIYRLPRGKGKFRSYVHNYAPGFRLYRRYVSCSFLLSLSAMLGSGMTMQRALTVVSDTSEDYLKSHTDAMNRKLAASASMQRAMDVDLMPKIMLLNVSQFIGGKDIGDSLMAVAGYEMDALGRKLDKYNTYLKLVIFGLGGYLIVTGYSAAIEPALALIDRGNSY